MTTQSIHGIRPTFARPRWLLLLLSLLAPAGASAQDAKKPVQATVVLVHGAFADGSSWREVIPLLQAKGVKVVSVQNPLSSLAADVDATMRVIAAQTGPVVLVGHSWGGTIITEAGNHDNVAALVYIAAFAPDAGQATNDTQKGRPLPGWVPLLLADTAGYLRLPESGVARYFAQDLPEADTKVIAATQGPIMGKAFDDKVSKAAWRSKPSWYLVASQDRMISADLQKAFASTIHATVSSVATSHLPFLVKPRETAAVIFAAVRSVQTEAGTQSASMR